MTRRSPALRARLRWTRRTAASGLALTLALNVIGVYAQTSDPNVDTQAKKPAQPNATVRKVKRKIKPQDRSQAKPSQSAAAPAPAPGVDPAEVERLRGTTRALIESMYADGIIPRAKAEQLLREARLAPLSVETPPAADVPPPGAASQAIAQEDTGEPAGSAAADANAPIARSAEPLPAGKPMSRRARRKAADAAAAAQAAGEPGAVRVPYVPQVVKDEIRDQIREEVIAQAKAERWAEPNSLPEWLDRFSFEGDLRVRYEGDYYSKDNVSALQYNAQTGGNLTNTTEDEGLFRYRARLGVALKLSDTWSAGIRLASGNTNNPVSTNQSLGNYSSRGALTIDRAYLRFDYGDAWQVSAGRFANPYYSTDLLWDEDLNFEGVTGSYKHRFGDNLRVFGTAGWHLVQYQGSTAGTPDPSLKYLLALQAGTDWDLTPRAKLRAGLAVYDYHNVEGRLNDDPSLTNAQDWTEPGFKQKGNTLFDISGGLSANSKFGLASKFRIVNLTTGLDLAYFEPYVVRLIGDYAKNIGFDRSEVRKRSGLDVTAKTSAYKVGMSFGTEGLKRFGDWQAFFTYRRLDRDAVLDAFTDSDFHLGGTNAKGYEVGGSFALDKNVWLRARWLSADEIEEPKLAIDVLQIDLNAKF